MILRLAMILPLAAAAGAAEVRIDIPAAAGRLVLAVAGDELAVGDAAGGHRRVALAGAPDPGLAGLEERARELARRLGAPVCAVGRASPAAQPCIITRELVLRLRPGADPVRVLAGADAAVRGPHPALERAWVVAAGGGLLAAVDLAARLAGRPGVEFAEPLVRQRLARKDDPGGSPLYGPAGGGVPAEQWHLNPALGGNHIGVQPVWNFASGASLGAGAVLNVIDNGVEAHPGFGANLAAAWGHSYRTGTIAIACTAADNHGTFVAGLAAARDGTGFGVGVAPRATLVPVQQADELYDSASLGHNLAAADPARRPWVVNCSWGPSDDGGTWAPMSLTFQAVLDQAVGSGRGGRGVVYCVAAGNGRGNGDRADYDEWAICPQTIGVGALTRTGIQASYSEDAAGLMVSAPGGDSDDPASGVYCATADRGGMASLDRAGAAGYVAGDYTVTANQSLRGTSFAAPLMAGAAALVLAAEPALGYRDLLHLLANHSARVDAGDAGVADPARRWRQNHAPVPRWHSVRYGFGGLDVGMMMGAIAGGRWVPVPALATIRQTGGPSFAVPAGLSASRTLAVDAGGSAMAAEHVTLEIGFAIPRRRTLGFRLTSPAGTVTSFPARPGDWEPSTGSETYRFTTVAHWGEDPAGTWTLAADNGSSGEAQITAWTLTVTGHRPYAAPAAAAVFPAVFAAPAAGSALLLAAAAGGRSGTGAVATRAMFDGIPVAATWDDAGHARIAVPAALLGQGSHLLVLRNPVFDSQFTGTPGAYGTVAWLDGPAATVTVAASAPAAPIIVAPAAGATVTGRRPAISGTAAAGTAVRIYEGSVPLGTATVAGSAWTFTPAADLAPGLHELLAFAVDAAEVASQPAAIAFLVADPVPPPADPPAVQPAGTVSAEQQALIAQAMQAGGGGGGCGLGGMGALVAALGALLALRRRAR